MAESPKHEPRTYSAQDVRQGEIVLRTRARRRVFIVGLAGLALIAVIARLFLR